MDGGDAVDLGGHAVAPAATAAGTAVELSSEPTSHDGRSEQLQAVGSSSSDGPIANESDEIRETDGRGRSPAGEGRADIAVVNEQLRAENEAFRMTIDANVSLKRDVDRLENAAKELEADRRTLQAQLEEARQRSDAQLQQIAELGRSLAAATEERRGRGGAAEGNVGVLQQPYDAESSNSDEQKVKDLVALISQLNEDDKVKTRLLEQKETQLKAKQALYEDLQTKHGRQDAPVRRAQTASSGAGNAGSRSCLMM